MTQIEYPFTSDSSANAWKGAEDSNPPQSRAHEQLPRSTRFHARLEQGPEPHNMQETQALDLGAGQGRLAQAECSRGVLMPLRQA